MMHRPSAFLLACVLSLRCVACARGSEPEPPLGHGSSAGDYLDPFYNVVDEQASRFAVQLQRARSGDAAALAVLQESFKSTANPDEKELLALFLGGKASADPVYHDYLISLVQTVVQSNPPFPMRVRGGRVGDDPADSFVAWCRARHLSADAAMALLVSRYPFRMVYCGNTEVEVRLLESALALDNFEVVQAAADRLVSLQVGSSLRLLASAGRRAPYPHRLAIAQSIARFGTQQSWAEVEALIPEPEYRDFIREQVSRR